MKHIKKVLRMGMKMLSFILQNVIILAAALEKTFLMR